MANNQLPTIVKISKINCAYFDIDLYSNTKFYHLCITLDGVSTLPDISFFVNFASQIRKRNNKDANNHYKS